MRARLLADGEEVGGEEVGDEADDDARALVRGEEEVEGKDEGEEGEGEGGGCEGRSKDSKPSSRTEMVSGKVMAPQPAATIAGDEAPTRSAAHVASPKEPKRSEPMPATSPTLSPTLSAMVPGLCGSSWWEKEKKA